MNIDLLRRKKKTPKWLVSISARSEEEEEEGFILRIFFLNCPWAWCLSDVITSNPNLRELLKIKFAPLHKRLYPFIVSAQEKLLATWGPFYGRDSHHHFYEPKAVYIVFDGLGFCVCSKSIL